MPAVYPNFQTSVSSQVEQLNLSVLVQGIEESCGYVPHLNRLENIEYCNRCEMFTQQFHHRFQSPQINNVTLLAQKTCLSEETWFNSYLNFAPTHMEELMIRSFVCTQKNPCHRLRIWTTESTINQMFATQKLGTHKENFEYHSCLLYTSPSPRDATLSRMPSSA